MINVKHLNDRNYVRSGKSIGELKTIWSIQTILGPKQREEKRIVATNVLNLMENINQRNRMKQNFLKTLHLIIQLKKGPTWKIYNFCLAPITKKLLKLNVRILRAKTVTHLNHGVSEHLFKETTNHLGFLDNTISRTKIFSINYRKTVGKDNILLTGCG